MSDYTPLLTALFAFACILFTVGLPVLVIVFIIGMNRRSGQLLDRWASQNGYHIIERERRRYRKGPFFWTSSNNQVIYRVTVRDAYGNFHRGWVRCGSYQLGSWSGDVDVQWDDHGLSP
jgi:hypothetical protein